MFELREPAPPPSTMDGLLYQIGHAIKARAMTLEPDGAIAGRLYDLDWRYTPAAGEAPAVLLVTHGGDARAIVRMEGGDVARKLGLHAPIGRLHARDSVTLTLTPDGVSLLLLAVQATIPPAMMGLLNPAAHYCETRFPGFNRGEAIRMELGEAMAYFGPAFELDSPRTCIPFVGLELALDPPRV